MIDIRSARIEDAADLVAIYAPYVEKTAITFGNRSTDCRSLCKSN